MTFANLPLFGVLGGLAALAALLFVLQRLRTRHIEVTVADDVVLVGGGARRAGAGFLGTLPPLAGVFAHPAHLRPAVACLGRPRGGFSTCRGLPCVVLGRLRAHGQASGRGTRAVGPEGGSAIPADGSPGSDLGRRLQLEVAAGRRGCAVARPASGIPDARRGAVGAERPAALAQHPRRLAGALGTGDLRTRPGGRRNARRAARRHSRHQGRRLPRAADGCRHRGVRHRPGAIGRPAACGCLDDGSRALARRNRCDRPVG